MRTFLIDTDTASDDAVALIMALKAPNVRVAAITVVSGNVALKQGTENALYTVELCDAGQRCECALAFHAPLLLRHGPQPLDGSVRAPRRAL